MNALDSVISAISPAWAFNRAKYRQALAAYESAEPSRLRNNAPDNRSGDSLVSKAGATIRGYARTQEQNYDLVEGILATLVDNVVGPTGISIEPQPMNTDGNIHDDFAAEILELYSDWRRRPEVTYEMDWAASERLIARSWFRDGEALVQLLTGRVVGIDHGTIVPFSVELIEADLLPMEFTDKGKGIIQGVERNRWGRVLAYHLYDEHPGDINYTHIFQNTTRIQADRMLHPKVVKRMRQARGVSIFAPMLRRIEDIKDYEESERIAARVAAAMCAYIKKGAPDEYTAPVDPEDDRSFKVKPGMIFDRLLPGEEVGSIDTNRPSTLLEGFRDSMVRMLAASSRATFSSIARKYDGTYSAQRQELVESWIGYKSLSMLLASQVSYPVYKKFLDTAILSGSIVIPPDINIRTLFDAECRGPAMPWIDPDKEEKANERAERAGHRSPQQIIRGMGGNPKTVMDEIALWRKMADEMGLVFTTDPKHEMQQSEEPIEPDIDE